MTVLACHPSRDYIVPIYRVRIADGVDPVNHCRATPHPSRSVTCITLRTYGCSAATQCQCCGSVERACHTAPPAAGVCGSFHALRCQCCGSAVRAFGWGVATRTPASPALQYRRCGSPLEGVTFCCFCDCLSDSPIVTVSELRRYRAGMALRRPFAVQGRSYHVRLRLAVTEACRLQAREGTSEARNPPVRYLCPYGTLTRVRPC